MNESFAALVQIEIAFFLDSQKRQKKQQTNNGALMIIWESGFLVANDRAEKEIGSLVVKIKWH